tara:strand:- start:1196 stop:1705 length:510 start_codon:yes stop_codon:yes gene_type:complete
MSADSRYTKLFPVSWDEMHRDAKALAWRLVELGPWKGIIAVARGGLVPAAVVARELDVRLIDTVCVSSYADMKEGNLKISQKEAHVLKGFEGDSKGWLVVDDMVDTGRTYQKIRELLPDAHFATVYAKPEGRAHVDSFITEVSQDTWILLPWDAERSPAPSVADLHAKK